jgi:hypothetical protein
MKNIVLRIILLLSSNLSFTQTVTLRVVNLIEEKATLSSLSGEKILFIDCVSVNNSNEYDLSLENKQSGIYRFAFNIMGCNNSFQCDY